MKGFKLPFAALSFCLAAEAVHAETITELQRNCMRVFSPQTCGVGAQSEPAQPLATTPPNVTADEAAYIEEATHIAVAEASRVQDKSVESVPIGDPDIACRRASNGVYTVNYCIERAQRNYNAVKYKWDDVSMIWRKACFAFANKLELIDEKEYLAKPWVIVTPFTFYYTLDKCTDWALEWKRTHEITEHFKP